MTLISHKEWNTSKTSQSISGRTLTGKLLKSNFEQLRLELGTNISILESNYSRYKPVILTESFISSTWEFMSKHSITLKDKTQQIPYLREGDCCIMQAFIDNNSIPRTSLKQLNRCRMFLKVFTLSDITNGTCNTIRNEI